MTRYALRTDKPRIVLSAAWYDSGWRYERWHCSDGRIGATGHSKQDAYANWLELRRVFG